MSDSAPPADDRTPAGYDPDGTPYYPPTAQQLGLCGPRSDDPGVGPDAARHTPTAGDQDERTFPQCIASSCANARAWDGLCAVHLELVESERERDALSGLLRGMARRVGRNRASEVRIVTALRAVVDSLHDENAVLRGEKPHAAAVIDRMREQAGDIKRFQVAVDLAHAALVAEESEHESFRLQIAALQARLSAVRELADDAEAGKTGTTMRSFLGPAAYVSTSELRRALDGPADLGLSPAPKDSQTLDGPAEAAEPAPRVSLDELFVENAEARDVVGPCRADEGNTGVDCMIEDANHPLPHRGWWRHEQDPIGETGIYIEWPVPERPDSDITTPDSAALDAAARNVLAEWSRMHPSGYLAMYPAMDALRAAVAAPRVEPALIGTWADESFVHHQDHKHPVEGCGYCPEEEDR